jgi:hypothetical protein
MAGSAKPEPGGNSRRVGHPDAAMKGVAFAAACSYK